jgi:site-specific recombinase XerD
VRDAVRRRHYSLRTEETYVHWIRRFIYFSGKRHPRELGAAEVTAFLNHLARERNVAASTQNQALSALLFLYREVLGMPLPWLDQLERAQRPAKLPTVLTREEVRRLLDRMRGMKWLMASLLYGAGLRLSECLKLRVKDVDFGYRQLVVRDAKGAKDRVTMLPAPVVEPMKRQIAHAREVHERDLAAGHGMVELPHALHASTSARHTSSAGSSSFHRTGFRRIRAAAPFAGTTFTRTTSPARRRRAQRASSSR